MQQDFSNNKYSVWCALINWSKAILTRGPGRQSLQDNGQSNNSTVARMQLQGYTDYANRWKASILSDVQAWPWLQDEVCSSVSYRVVLVAPFHTPCGCLLKAKVWVGTWALLCCRAMLDETRSSFTSVWWRHLWLCTALESRFLIGPFSWEEERYGT